METVAVTRTSWQIPREGGLLIRGEARVREGESPRIAVVICHGFKGFRKWGFFPSLARGLALQGYAAITFDMTHNGVGDDGVDFSALDRFSEQTHTGNLEEISSILDIIDDGILPDSPEKVILFGHSRGGAEALLITAADRRVDGLITWAAIDSLEGRWTEEQIATWERGETVFIENTRTGQKMPIGPGYWADIVASGDGLDVSAAAARVTVPWLIVHGEADETVSPNAAGELFAAAGTNAELCLVEGASHTFGATHPYAGAPDELKVAFEATLEWLSRV